MANLSFNICCSQCVWSSQDSAPLVHRPPERRAVRIQYPSWQCPRLARYHHVHTPWDHHRHPTKEKHMFTYCLESEVHVYCVSWSVLLILQFVLALKYCQSPDNTMIFLFLRLLACVFYSVFGILTCFNHKCNLLLSLCDTVCKEWDG